MYDDKHFSLFRKLNKDCYILTSQLQWPGSAVDISDRQKNKLVY